MAAPQPQVAGAGKRRAARKTRSTASTPRTTERAPIRKSASNARRLKATEFVVDEKPAREPGGTLSELLAAASNNTLALNPLLGIQPIDIASAGASLVKALALSPRKLVSHWGRLMLELNHVTRGNSALEPDARDRRFSDAAWKSNGAYRRLLQGYLATHRELNEFVNHSSIEDRDKSRAKFFVGLLMDAIAPSNWVLGNPAVVRKAFETGGQSLLSGLQNFLDDVRDNRKLPAQVDATPFRVGENVATSPGQVVLRHDLFELLQFTPTTEKVHRRPLVMSPPQVNKYYVVDLTPEKSLIKWATDSGIQLFVISWRNPTVKEGHWGLDEYAKALDAAVDAAREICASDDVNMWGTCSGGMTLAAYLGWLASRNDRKVKNVTWAVCILDTNAAFEDSALSYFHSPSTLRLAKARSTRRGIVTGEEMATMFAWLRPNDLIWNYWVSNYLLGNSPPAFDILAWNADVTRLPGRFHCDLLDILERNPYVSPGTLEVNGLSVDFSKVSIGVFVIAGITDHITPWRACYGTARLFGPKSMFVLANAGHVQSMVNPPGAPKAFYFTGAANIEDPEQWLDARQSERHEGSWWPHWRQWVQARSGALVAAPRFLGSKKSPPLGPAPGKYVMDR